MFKECTCSCNDVQILQYISYISIYCFYCFLSLKNNGNKNKNDLTQTISNSDLNKKCLRTEYKILNIYIYSFEIKYSVFVFIFIIIFSGMHFKPVCSRIYEYSVYSIQIRKNNTSPNSCPRQRRK